MRITSPSTQTATTAGTCSRRNPCRSTYAFWAPIATINDSPSPKPASPEGRSITRRRGRTHGSSAGAAAGTSPAQDPRRPAGNADRRGHGGSRSTSRTRTTAQPSVHRASVPWPSRSPPLHQPGYGDPDRHRGADGERHRDPAHQPLPAPLPPAPRTATPAAPHGPAPAFPRPAPPAPGAASPGSVPRRPARPGTARTRRDAARNPPLVRTEPTQHVRAEQQVHAPGHRSSPMSGSTPPTPNRSTADGVNAEGTGASREGHHPPFSTYSAPGGLRQGPGRAAQSPAEAVTCGEADRS